MRPMASAGAFKVAHVRFLSAFFGHPKKIPVGREISEKTSRRCLPLIPRLTGEQCNVELEHDMAGELQEYGKRGEKRAPDFQEMFPGLPSGGCGNRHQLGPPEWDSRMVRAWGIESSKESGKP